MNKAIYTLFHSSKWKVALTLVFTWCCLSLQTAYTQDIKINYTANDTIVGPQVDLDDCDATSNRLFTDDGSNDGNYNDATHARMDTITICPENKWHQVKVSFTEFDIENDGDTLFAFDGNKAEVIAALAVLADAGATTVAKDQARLIGLGSGTGVGVSKAFGGWVQA